MATCLSDVIHHLGYTALAREADDLRDAELLERFLARREEAAFAVLVRRHAPMVIGYCLNPVKGGKQDFLAKAGKTGLKLRKGGVSPSPTRRPKSQGRGILCDLRGNKKAPPNPWRGLPFYRPSVAGLL